MGKARRPTQQEELARLGIINLSDTGLPTYQTEDNRSATEILQSQQRIEGVFGTPNAGDFSTNIVYDPSKTGVNYKGPDSDLQQDIYDSQSWFETVRNGLGRLLLTTGTKIGSGAAFLASMPYEIARGAFTDVEGNFISRAADTGLVKAMEGLEEGVKEALPIYKSKYYEDGNVFQKATKIEFWMDDVVDGVAFALSSYVGGGAVAKLGTGAKLATGFRSMTTRALGRAAATTDEALRLRNVAGLARNIDKVTATALMTSSEAMFEAAEVQKSILNNKDLQHNMSQEDLNVLAATRARDTYLLNMAAIAPSNLFEMSSLFNKTKLLGRKTLPSQKNADINIGVEASPGKLAGTLVDNTKELTGVRALWSNPKTKLARTIIGNAAAEGLYEENIQYSIQKIGEYMNNNLDDPTGNIRSFYDSAQMLWNNKVDMATGLSRDPERLQAAVLGSIIGTGQSTLSNIPALNRMMGGDGGILAEEANDKAKRDKLLAALNNEKLDLNLNPLDIFQRTPERKVAVRTEVDPNDPNAKKFFVSDTGESVDEKEVTQAEFDALVVEAGIDPAHPDFEIGKAVEGKIGSSIMIDDKGNPMIHEGKLKAQLAKLQRKELLDDVHEAMSQSPEANKLGLQMVRNEKLSAMAYEHFRAGMAHLLYDKLEMFSQANTEELAAFGLSPNDDIQAEKERAKTYIQGLEKLYNNVENGLLPDTNSKEDAMINEMRKAVAFDRGQRAYTLQVMLRENLKELTTLSKDIETFAATVKPTDTNNALLNELRVSLDLLTGTLMNSDAADPINNAPGVIKQFNNDLGKLLNWINQLIDDISNPQDADEQQARQARINDTSIVSPYHSLKNKLERIEIVNEELTTAIEETVDEYRKITDITIQNKLATAANVGLGIMTGAATLGMINYDRFMGMRTNGFQYFKNNQQDILTKYSKRPGRTIEMTDELTTEQYDKFVQRKIRLMKLTRRLQGANRVMFGKIWKDFLKEGGSFGELIKLILDTEAILTPQDANEIIALVEERVNRYERLMAIRQTVIDSLSKAQDDLNFFSDVLSDQEIKDLEYTITASNKQLDTIDKELNLIASNPEFDIANPQELIALLRSRVQDNIIDLDDAGLEREIVDDLMNPAKVALAAFNNNNDYEDIGELERVKNVLANIKRIYTDKKDLLNNDKFNKGVPNGFWKELNDLIDEVDKAITEVEKRLSDRNRAELMAYKNYIQSLYDVLFLPNDGLIAQIEPLDTDLQSKIDTALQTFNSELAAAQADTTLSPLAVMEAGIAIESMIWSVLRSLKIDANTKTKVDAIFKSKNEQLLNQIKSSPFYNTYKDKVAVKTSTENDGSAAKRIDDNLHIMSAASFAKGILEVMFDVGARQNRVTTPFDSNPNSAYGKYMVHQDLHTLYSDLQNEDRTGAPPEAPATKAELLDMIELLIELKAIRELSQPSLFTQVQTNMYEGLLANLKAEKNKYDNQQPVSLLPFSLRQRSSIFQLLRFMYTPNIELTGTDPDNLGFWAYMRGAAGTGKTEVIVKWLNTILGKVIDQDNILVGASNPNAAVGVNRSIPSTKGGLNFEEFVTELETAAKENRSYGLIVFDEIGALDVNQLSRFVNATKEMRKVNPNVKVIVLGDPNQLVTDTTGVPSIELKFGTASIPGLPFIQQIDPLTVRYRSDNSAVVNIQDAFIRKTTAVTKLMGKINKNPREILTGDDPLYGSFVEDSTGQLLTILKNNIETSPTRERAIIVATEAQKNSWIGKLSAALGPTNNVRVMTVYEAQGMSISEVYVDMQYNPTVHNQIATFNKAMYTATSRAREFLYVGNIPDSSTVGDPNMMVVMQQLASAKTIGYDVAIANLEKQKKYRDIFNDNGGASPQANTPPPGSAPTNNPPPPPPPPPNTSGGNAGASSTATTPPPPTTGTPSDQILKQEILDFIKNNTSNTTDVSTAQVTRETQAPYNQVNKLLNELKSEGLVEETQPDK